MKTFSIGGKPITFEGFAETITQGLARRYYDAAANKNPEKFRMAAGLTFRDDGTEVWIDYCLHGQRFERIRRITGYLTGTTDRWNSAKKHELEDRIAHDTERTTATIIHNQSED